jgi:3-deoxy-manno-octulosonate cytidylyltransferase (CMP-KDO synthetase)
MMKFICVIPARYGSTRFPGKPLARIAGSPMIEWVYQRAAQVKIFEKVIVATDDPRILQAVRDFGGQAELTPAELPSGTDRVAYLARKTNSDVYVNVQGDEPLIAPQLLVDVCAPYSDPAVLMTTAVSKINSVKELTDPNLVRVALDKDGNALYFSRAVIPYLRDETDIKQWFKRHIFYKHIGIYTYRRDFLLQLSDLPQGGLERAERLEQLRVLENGFKIRTVLTAYNSLCVDTPEDLDQVENYIKLNKLQVDSN